MEKKGRYIGKGCADIGADERFPIMRLRVGEISAQDNARSNAGRVKQRGGDERTFHDIRPMGGIAVGDDVVNLNADARRKGNARGNGAKERPKAGLRRNALRVGSRR